MKNGKLAHLSSFAGDRRGNFAVMGAVALVPMLMVAGMAVDTGRAFSEKTRLEDALDAAVLAAGRAYSTGRVAESDLEAYLTRIFHANFRDKDGTGGTRRIENYNLDPINGVVSASAISDFEIAFKIIGGGEPLELKANSAASFGGKDAEVAFTLDVTSSMRDSNVHLRRAVEGAIDLLLASNGDGEERVRISLIPYSVSVRVGEFLSDYIYIDDATPMRWRLLMGVSLMTMMMMTTMTMMMMTTMTMTTMALQGVVRRIVWRMMRKLLQPPRSVQDT